MKRRILGFLLSICLVISLFPSMYTEAATTTCTIYNGTNVEWQNYSKWASPTTSYLSECADGTIMRVQYGSSIEGILVEYYNTSYDFISNKIIPEELPIFGAFYETDTNYFLLTGQTNEQESAEVEVYRITKYDKQWKRIGSTGLYDCNTTIPFHAGSARMDDWGKYLLIRTCHEMYRTSDGYNHQANVTIQLDMETMQITDSFTDIMNTSCGYVSHSFNQFIKIEDGKIVAVDHGDAHLRGVTLIRYKTDLSTGKFVPIWESFCEVTNAMKFPGEIGENVTGAAIGGFELSDSRYLITGHSVEQDSNNLTRKTRNVFVIAVDKNKLESKINWLTSYEEGDGTTSTPQMVKINDNRFLVLWSRDNTVYYTEVDGIGKQIGTTYSISGSLSDCVPIVVGNKIIWYTWKNETVIFYEISINNLEQAQSTTIENGHQYESQGVVDGHVILYCPICGTTYEMPIATSISIGWNTNGGGVYSSIISTRREVGDRLYYWIEPEPLNANKEMEVVISDPEIISWTPSSEVKGVLTMLKPGTATVIFRPKFNPDVGRTYTITVKGDIPITSIALNKTELELEEGTSEKLSVSYTPSDTTDEKKVTWKSDNESVAKVSSDGTVTAVKAGTATITATTANGKTASCVITVMPEPEKPIQIYYRTHVQNLGWQSYVTDGVMSGTTGKSLRLEGIEIYLENNKIGGSIEYRTHVQNLGWQPYVTDGAMSGTKGKSLRLEAIQIRLTGELAQKYDVYYRTHIQDLGWLGWAVNDGKSGSAGLSKRLEGIQIRLVEKGESAPGTTENAYMTNEKTYHPSVSYSTHVQNLGWQSEVKDGVMSGTKGKSLRLEGIKIRVNGDGLSGGIEYSTHVQNLGWQPYVCNGEMAGTKGKSLRLEGIKIRLTGELAKKYSVEYRTHVQNLGWQDWVRDDSLSGTKGKGLRLEGIEIRIVKK